MHFYYNLTIILLSITFQNTAHKEEICSLYFFPKSWECNLPSTPVLLVIGVSSLCSVWTLKAQKLHL